MTARLDITSHNLVAGDTHTIGITFRNADGSLYNFSGVTKAWFTAKKDYSQADADALVGPLDSATHPTQITYGVAGPGEGKAQIVLLPDDTAGLGSDRALKYDFQVLAGSTISTLAHGEILIIHQVTRASS